MKRNPIKGSEIENVLTRFFFRKENPCFQIVIKVNRKQIVYKECEDYKLYKKTIDTLRTAKKDDLEVILSLKIQNVEVAVNAG
ncbi:MAG: hypothetical protein ACPG19_04765 [Saprospiraceae bacterium]